MSEQSLPPLWRRTMRRSTARRLLTCVAVGAVLGAAGIEACAPPAHADTIVGCKTDLWGFLASQRRELCDGPIHADGSWLRRRVIFVPAHQVPLSCFTSGGPYFASTNCSGGYYQPYSEVDRETYAVTPATVLGDEPGHLDGGA